MKLLLTSRKIPSFSLLAALAVLLTSLTGARAASGTWATATSGTWAPGVTAPWSGGFVADGADSLALFSQDLTVSSTIRYNYSGTIGYMTFADTASSFFPWLLDNNGNSANVLTLATTSGTAPTITANTAFTGTTALISLVLAGNQGMTKAGTGLLVLTGSNTYTGTTTISAGGLQLGSGGTSGSVAGNISNSGTLIFNRSDTVNFTNAISGGGRVHQNGSGTLVLSNTTNSFSGVLALNAGTIQGNDSTVFSGASGTTSVLGVGNTIGFANNTTLQLRVNGLNDSSAQTISFRNTLLLSTAGNITVDVDRQSATGGTGKTIGMTGNTTIATSGTLNVTGANGFSLSLPTLTAGTGGVGGTVVLNPTSADLVVGTLVNANGTDHTVVLGGTSTGSKVTGGLNNSAGNVLSVTKSGAGTWTLSGSSSYTGATSVTAGSLILSGAGQINNTSGISVTGGKFIYGSSVALNRNVTVNGGAFRQNSASNYTGVLTFTSGTIGGSNLSGQNLSIGANQVISPGNSTGTLTSGNETWASLGGYDWELNNATGTAGSTTQGWDLLSISGDLTLTATSGSKFNINLLSLDSAQQAGLAQNFNSASSYSFLIADATNAITTFDATAFNLNTSGFQNSFTPGAWSIARGDSVIGGDNTQLYLVYAGVPEPATWALLAGGGTLLLTVRRRRQS